MSVVVHEIARMGFLLPESVLHTHWFSVLTAFVAINTLIYATLGITKALPKIRWQREAAIHRRSESRSIYPDASA